MPAADDALEHRLLATWGTDELAVYADHLLERDDPRGELIALELDAQRTRQWHEQRFRAIEAWLGRDLGEKAAPFLRYGFLEDVGDDELSAELLASPAGEYLHTFRSQNDVKTVQVSLERLASRPRPWLAELTIHLWSDPITLVPRLDADLVDEVIARTPRLQSLDISGKLVADRFAHPSVTVATVSGADALGEVAFPAVKQLDLAMHRVHRYDRAKTESITLSPARLPALVHLDLSRNEPGRTPPHALRGDADLFELVRRMPILAQLETLVLPSILDEMAITRVAEIVARMPRKVAVRVARSYRGTTHRLAVERLGKLDVELPAQRPWPHPDTLRGGFALVGIDQWNQEEWLAGIDLRDTFDFLERNASTSDYAVWEELWTWYAGLARRVDVPVPRDLFERALVAGGDRFVNELRDWKRIADALRTQGEVDLVVRRISPRQTGRWRRGE